MKNLIFILLTLIAVGCSHQQTQDTKHPDALIVLRGAKDISYREFKGTYQLSYRLNAHYPANLEIGQINNRLKQHKWNPLEDDFLNPDLSTSHIRGWTQFINGTVRPERQVHQWLAQWENPKGDLLWVTFRYSSPEGTETNLDELEVSMIFIPAEFAAKAKNALNAQPKDSADRETTMVHE